MKQLITFGVLALLSSFCFAQDYTLETALPSKVAKGELSSASFFVEIMQETFKRSGLKLKTHKDLWIRNQKKVMSAKPSKGLLITPLTRTKDRENSYDWILPITTYKLQFITNDRTVDIGNIEALKTIPVCVYRESPAEYKLRDLGFKKIRTKVQRQKCFQGLKKKTTKAILTHGKIAAIKGYKLIGGNPDTLIYGRSFAEETLYLASTKGAMSDSDKQTLNDTFNALKTDGTYDKILAKYY